MNAVILAALSVWTIMTLTWIVSVFKKDVSIVDTIYSLNFIGIAAAYQSQAEYTLTTTLLSLSVTLWALRLMLHLGYKNWGQPEDHRYQRFRKNYGAERYWWFSYLQVFMLQGLFVWIFALPIHVAYLNTQTTLITPLFYLGEALFTFGFLYESIADYQLVRFKNKAPEKALLTSGLWKYSRHPNHFGEIVLWYGIATLSASQFNPYAVLAYIGAIAIMFTLHYISGPVQQESRMEKNKDKFNDYRNNTPRIVPKIF